jgi:ADP-ribose pyrophosphatase YjhB (NUDIX family)
MTQESPILRPSVRAILLDPNDRVLLFRVDDPVAGALWITPGGGIETGESDLDCLHREIREETGLSGCDVGPLVWLREHVFPWKDSWIRQVERYYLARTQDIQVHDGFQQEDEMLFLKEARWWSLEEMARASTEHFVPRHFARHLEPLLAGNFPPKPIVVGR